MFRIYAYILFNKVDILVDMVGMFHDDLLAQWRHIPMCQFRTNIFLIRTTSNYLWARVLKVNYFHLPIHVANELWNFGSMYFNAKIDLYIIQHDLKPIFWDFFFLKNLINKKQYIIALKLSHDINLRHFFLERWK